MIQPKRDILTTNSPRNAWKSKTLSNLQHSTNFSPNPSAQVSLHYIRVQLGEYWRNGIPGCQVLREEIKPTCLRQPQIAPVGFCTSKESVIQSVEDTGDHFIDNYDEDQSLLRRRRRRRRNQLLRSKFDRNPAAKKVWSYFDGSCMAYTADSCINTKNSFRSRAECKHSK